MSAAFSRCKELREGVERVNMHRVSKAIFALVCHLVLVSLALYPGDALKGLPVPLDLLRFDPLKVNPVRPLVAAVTGRPGDGPWSYQVQVFDLKGQILTSMPVGEYPLALGWNHTGDLLYMLFGQEEVGIIDFSNKRIAKKNLGRSDSRSGGSVFIEDLLGRPDGMFRSEVWRDPSTNDGRRLWSLFPYQEDQNSWARTPLFKPLRIYRHAITEQPLDPSAYYLIEDNCVRSLELNPVRFSRIWCSPNVELWPVRIAANGSVLSVVLSNGEVLFQIGLKAIIRIGRISDKPITSIVPLDQGLLWTDARGPEKLNCLSVRGKNRIVRKINQGVYAMKAGHGKIFIQTFADQLIVLDENSINCDDSKTLTH